MYGVKHKKKSFERYWSVTEFIHDVFSAEFFFEYPNGAGSLFIAQAK